MAAAVKSKRLGKAITSRCRNIASPQVFKAAKLRQEDGPPYCDHDIAIMTPLEALSGFPPHIQANP
jgi:hypothetical protein